MNEVSKNVKVVPFDVRPIFSIYEELLQLYRMPEPEFIMSLYEVRVKNKVKEIELTYPMIERGYPWGDKIGLDEDELMIIGDHLGMRPILLESELIDVLETNYMFYYFNGEFRNMPIAGVW